MTTLIVFSKDRAMQLDSLLRSVEDHCTGIDHVAVIAKVSSQLHIDAYKRLRETADYDELAVDGLDGGLPLGRHIAALADNYSHDVPTDHIALAVDDQIFYRPSDFKKAEASLEEHGGFAWSWRLGSRPEVTQFCPCPLDECTEHWLCSPLVDDPDYRYLFHSDGALYKTNDYVSMLDKYLPDWKTGDHIPNDLEAAVAKRRAQWAPTVGPHLGPLQPTCITFQVNAVQNKYGSPACQIIETSCDVLAHQYLAGKRVDNEILYEQLSKEAAHFNPPGARPTHVYASSEASKFWASCIR